jgi:hypothetical protein
MLSGSRTRERERERVCVCVCTYNANIVARLRNNCCNGNATFRSLCIVVDPHVAVNNINPLSVAVEKQKCVVFYCCRPKKYFVLSSRI